MGEKRNDWAIFKTMQGGGVNRTLSSFLWERSWICFFPVMLGWGGVSYVKANSRRRRGVVTALLSGQPWLMLNKSQGNCQVQRTHSENRLWIECIIVSRTVPWGGRGGGRAGCAADIIDEQTNDYSSYFCCFIVIERAESIWSVLRESGSSWCACKKAWKNFPGQFSVSFMMGLFTVLSNLSWIWWSFAECWLKLTTVDGRLISPSQPPAPVNRPPLYANDRRHQDVLYSCLSHSTIFSKTDAAACCGHVTALDRIHQRLNLTILMCVILKWTVFSRMQNPHQSLLAQKGMHRSSLLDCECAKST